MLKKNRTIFLILGLTIAATGLTAWTAVSLTDLHEKLSKHSQILATTIVCAGALSAVAAALSAGVLLWKLGRPEKEKAKAPSDVIQAAEVQAREAEKVIVRVKDEAARKKLERELTELRADKERDRFHVVIFGTGSAGKTSLINALLGREAGKTEATLGTTKRAEGHTHVVEGLDGTLWITDTPGLAEAGVGGERREAEARELAARADLLIFLVAGDLVRAEYEPLAALAAQGKRSIVALNKKDLYNPDDLNAILSKLRDRLRGVVSPLDVVAICAAPRPVPVRTRLDDGTFETVLEAEPVDIDPLIGRIQAILDREGESLRAGNLLLRAHLIGKEAQNQLTIERDREAQEVIARFQWITAGTVFANPVPALDLLAAGAVQFQMISEVAHAYGVELSLSHARMIGGQMIQSMLKLGIVESAASLIAGLFKSTLIGYAAGGAAQAVTMAYLTHVSGQTFAEYFRRGQSWGDGGMQGALARQFKLHTRAEFLQEFGKQAIDHVVKRAIGPREPLKSSRAGTDA